MATPVTVVGGKKKIRKSTSKKENDSMISEKNPLSQELLDKLPNFEEVQQRVNESYDALTVITANNKCAPLVCVVCDKIISSMHDLHELNPYHILKDDQLRRLLSWEHNNDMRRFPEIEEAFTFHVTDDIPSGLFDFTGIALSPRAVLQCKLTKKGEKKKSSNYLFSCCRSCHYHIYREKNLPPNSIVNKNYVGCTPQELLILTEIEVSVITPIKGYGIIHTYTGGAMKGMKGCLTLMRTKERSTAKAMVQLESVGLDKFNVGEKQVIVLAGGNMTPNQYEKCRKKAEINVNNVLRAIDWLHYHNENWRKVPLETLREEFKSKAPIFVDNRKAVDSQNTNIEEVETFEVFYPDSTNNEQVGGFSSGEEFRSWVIDLRRAGFDAEFKYNLQREFLTSGDEGIVDALPLQFPYGIGGIDEIRLNPDGTRSKCRDVNVLLKHYSRLSQPVFQMPLFQLIAFNYVCKHQIMKTARLHTRNTMTAKAIAEGIPPSDLKFAINQRRLNRRDGTIAANKLLNACDASGRELPHTDERAKKARNHAESMYHHFGPPSIWLSFTPDDCNSHLMEIWSDVTVDDGTDIPTLTDRQCKERCRARNKIRLDYPGLAALNFEACVEIVMMEVIGWNMNTNTRTKIGYFGAVEGIYQGIEEQGRKTLHIHVQIWIEGYQVIQRQISYGTDIEKRAARELMTRYHERIVSTTMFPTDKCDLDTLFDHDCTEPVKRKRKYDTVHDQALRELRCRLGYKHNKGKFAFCRECGASWTNEELLCRFINNVEKIREPDENGEQANGADENEILNERLLVHIHKYQKGRTGQRVPSNIVPLIRAKYNNHLSCHVNSCFKCLKGVGKFKHKCNEKCECRMRLPDRGRKRSRVREVAEGGVTWYSFNGVHRKEILLQHLPKRNLFDSFQNPSCEVISNSKIACNSNAQLVTPGPISIYITKYVSKRNQKDEESNYEDLRKHMQKMDGNRVHDDDKREAIRVVTGASFAHHKANTISATFASFLLRNESRFYCSHEFIYCPIKDLIKLVENQEVTAQAAFGCHGPFFENSAIHYLCRPVELESLNVKEFFEQYTVTYKKNGNRQFNEDEPDNDEEGIDFVADNGGGFQHPSFHPTKKTFSQQVRRLATPGRIQIVQYMFSDAANFKADMLTCDASMFNAKMENNARLILALFQPHRSRKDLIPSSRGLFPYTTKLQEIYNTDVLRMRDNKAPLVFTVDNERYLQNIQDCTHNCTRFKLDLDDLNTCTTHFHNPDELVVDPELDSDDEEEEEVLPNDICPYEKFHNLLQGIDDTPDSDNQDPSMLPKTLNNFDFSYVRNKGKNECGYISGLKPPTVDDKMKNVMLNDTNYARSRLESADTFPSEKMKHTCAEIVRVLWSRTVPRERPNVFKNNPTVKVKRATGSAASIRHWAMSNQIDHLQRRAFESITAAFVLTFYDLPEHDTSTPEELASYNTSKDYLYELMGVKEEDSNLLDKRRSLIMLLHGPGGSGKSTVISMIVEYARDFCEMLAHPFTSRTIAVTAMSGVAATLIKGETTHSVLGLNRDGFSQEDIDEFADTRLIVIDEISFAGKEDFVVMDSRTRNYFEKRYKPYGGCNVVFCGDFHQMEPVGRLPIYVGERTAQFNTFVNGFIELDGMHRYTKHKDVKKRDPLWGALLMRRRAGQMTVEDIETINRNCVISPSHMPPAGIRVATYSNAERAAINAAMFEEFASKNKPINGGKLHCAVVIFMDRMVMKDSKGSWVPMTSNREKKIIYEHCSEDDCRIGAKNGKNVKGRVDPVLKLYYGCPLMYTKNTDVGSGQANGSCVVFEGVFLKAGEAPFKLKLRCGTTVNGLFASQVKFILVRHEDPEIIPATFEIAPTLKHFYARLKLDDETIWQEMQGMQFNVSSNTATTGHKLQGATVDDLFVNDWHYKKNWDYVVMSRVTTMLGLYINKKLRPGTRNYDVDERAVTMMDEFRSNKQILPVTQERYKEMDEAFDGE
jgi:hypothetical protein